MAKKPMIASEKQMTDGQIENFLEKLRAAMRKHRFELSADVAQQVLGTENLGMALFAFIRERAASVSEMIVRHVKIKVGESPRKILENTGRKLYVTDSVVAAMPRDESPEAIVYFFKLDLKGAWISDDDLEKEYALRGLKPAGPYALAAVNQAEPDFADSKPNCTHWKDKDGNWCYAAFDRWSGDRSVLVYRDDRDWSGHWFFAGVRK